MANRVETLVIARIIVGLTKQTMTVSTALMTSMSSDAGRATALGRLSSASTLAFLSGQTIGGVLSSNFGRRAPCFVASGLFALNLVLTLTLLPNSVTSAQTSGGTTLATAPSASPAAAKRSGGAALRAGLLTFVRNFGAAFRHRRAAEALGFRLAYAFLMRATYSLHSLYEQQRWELDPQTTGYLSTYATALGLGVNTLLIGPLARRVREADLLVLALALSAGNAAFEGSHATFLLYACVNMPIGSINGALTRTGLSSLFSKAVQTADAGAALSVFDVLNSAVGVLAPMYGGLLLNTLGVSKQPLISAVHYLLLLALARFTIARATPTETEASPAQTQVGGNGTRPASPAPARERARRRRVPAKPKGA